MASSKLIGHHGVFVDQFDGGRGGFAEASGQLRAILIVQRVFRLQLGQLPIEVAGFGELALFGVSVRQQLGSFIAVAALADDAVELANHLQRRHIVFHLGDGFVQEGDQQGRGYAGDGFHVLAHEAHATLSALGSHHGGSGSNDAGRIIMDAQQLERGAFYASQVTGAGGGAQQLAQGIGALVEIGHSLQRLDGQSVLAGIGGDLGAQQQRGFIARLEAQNGLQRFQGGGEILPAVQ